MSFISGPIGASMAADATIEGANITADAMRSGAGINLEMFRQAQRTLQPFVNLGTAAGATLANQVVSPAERQRQFEQQRLLIQSDIDRLSRTLGFNDVPQVMGENGSERWAAAVGAANATRTSQLEEAKSKLALLDRQSELDRTQATARSAEGIQASTLYEFQRDLGERNIKRQLSATGRLDTGFGMETLSNFYRALGAEETDRQTGRLFNLTTLGANAGAQQATNAIQTGTAQANLFSQIGQVQGQGIAQAGQITGAGIQNIGKGITQVGMLALLAANAGLFDGGGGSTGPGTTGGGSAPADVGAGTTGGFDVRGYAPPAQFQSAY